MAGGSITLEQVAEHAAVLIIACSRCDRIPELLRLLSNELPQAAINQRLLQLLMSLEEELETSRRLMEKSRMLIRRARESLDAGHTQVAQSRQQIEAARKLLASVRPESLRSEPPESG
jgi:hypothetical protein